MYFLDSQYTLRIKFIFQQVLLESAKAVFGNAGIVSEIVDSCINYNKGMKLLGLLYES